MSVLDPEAAQLLRRAVQIAGGGLVTVAALRRAVEDPADTELAPSRLRGDAALTALVQRASDLARLRASDSVRRADLVTALREAEATAAGLDLERLQFARWRVERAYPAAPRTRQYQADAPMAAGVSTTGEDTR